MREYSRQIETDLREVEKSSIDDCSYPLFLSNVFVSLCLGSICFVSSSSLLETDIKEGNNLAYLHTQIRSCDAILETMESLLTGFQVIS